jgi:hypothetical protein
MVICRSHTLLRLSAPMGRLVRTSPGSPTRLLVVYSKRRPTAGLKLPVGRHIKQQERRGNQAEDEVGGGSGGLSRAGGEVQFEAQLLVAWQVWAGPIDLAFALSLAENES